MGDWESDFPLVPGHEMAGRILKIGNDVTKFKVGDYVLVGTMLDSCGFCNKCKSNLKQYCENDATWTYNGRERNPGDIEPTGNLSYGGYSCIIVSNEKFVYKLPTNIDIKNAAPILCAGITVYWPLKQMDIKGKTIGIAGIGGIGHMGVKLANKIGAKVIALTTTKWKLSDSINNLGAIDSILMTDKQKLEEYNGKLDCILSTIPQAHDLGPYINLLKFNGTLWIVGALFPFDDFDPGMLSEINGILRSSIIGGVKDTEELINFCSKNNIQPDVEIINAKDINGTYKKLLKSQVKYRFVIDINSLY